MYNQGHDFVLKYVISWTMIPPRMSDINEWSKELVSHSTLNELVQTKMFQLFCTKVNTS